jgi:hypothetical protein
MRECNRDLINKQVILLLLFKRPKNSFKKKARLARFADYTTKIKYNLFLSAHGIR